MLVVSLWQPTICKMEQCLVTLQQLNCCCSRMLWDLCSLLSSWIKLVMLQLTSCLQEKEYWLWLYFTLCDLWNFLLKVRTVVQCMLGEYIFDDCCYNICTSFAASENSLLSWNQSLRWRSWINDSLHGPGQIYGSRIILLHGWYRCQVKFTQIA